MRYETFILRQAQDEVSTKSPLCPNLILSLSKGDVTGNRDHA